MRHDEYQRWADEHTMAMRYGRSLAVSDNLRKILEANGVHDPSYWVTSKLPEKEREQEWEQEYLCDFNTEGEKQMEKIDWSKPLRAFKTPSHEVVDAKVYTYKSGKQRVIWVDGRVYPVDDQGRAVADVDYGPNWVRKGSQIVENVPEEKFFLGLWRETDGSYWLTDGGTVSDMGTMNYWKRLMTDQPHWIVDTRKSAEPPKTIAHDPEDYVTIRMGLAGAVTSHLMIKRRAEAYVSEPGEQVVRVRTTPAPVDTSRYIQLYRQAGQNDAWEIDGRGDGRQEFTWSELYRARGYHEYVYIKVRD